MEPELLGVAPASDSASEHGLEEISGDDAHRGELVSAWKGISDSQRGRVTVEVVF